MLDSSNEFLLCILRSSFVSLSIAALCVLISEMLKKPFDDGFSLSIGSNTGTSFSFPFNLTS